VVAEHAERLLFVATPRGVDREAAALYSCCSRRVEGVHSTMFGGRGFGLGEWWRAGVGREVKIR
jgi:hypothetical protein